LCLPLQPPSFLGYVYATHCLVDGLTVPILWLRPSDTRICGIDVPAQHIISLKRKQISGPLSTSISPGDSRFHRHFIISTAQNFKLAGCPKQVKKKSRAIGDDPEQIRPSAASYLPNAQVMTMSEIGAIATSLLSFGIHIRTGS
jgi:hypothetical protein